MTHPSKRKGDKAELEVQGIIRDLTGFPARRALGAGRTDDVGDIHGVPETCVQVTALDRLTDALAKLPELERQQKNKAATFAGLFVRRRGGSYVVVLTPEQWATLLREALAYTGQGYTPEGEA